MKPKKVKTEAERVSAAAAVATAAAISQDDDYQPLVRLIERERSTRGKGRKPLWLLRLGAFSARELAAAILYHVFEARIRARDEDLPPYALSVGSSLGADLSSDKAEQPIIGVQLLLLAAKVGVIEPLEDHGGVRVGIRDATHNRLRAIVNGGAAHIRHRVRVLPPVGVDTKKPHDMLIPRPDAPPRVREAADKVQGTAWRINRAVLDVLLETMNLETTLEQLMTVKQARELLALEKFYFPVRLDSRGRMYQRGSFLTYTSGADYARGLLEFADGAILDDAGLGWLAWHMAQMWGKDLPYIMFGDGRQWATQTDVGALSWRNAKHPAQFLAARIAWLDAAQGKRCRIPVRLDASCSGLQHLALLARDTELARAVNLWGDYHGDRQGMNWLELPPKPDFYETVAAACDLRPEAGRDQVKAVLVPMLYMAGENECAKALADLRTEGKSRRTNKEDRRLSKVIRAAAKQLAPHAFDVLRWFSDVANAHNGEEAEIPGIKGVVQRVPAPVRWTVPSGFEAVQDYRVVDKNPTRPDRQVQIAVGGRSPLHLVKRFLLTAIDTKQQAISLPSSLVHSLDAALLVEIVSGADIDQWAVAHDAFGVPASRAWDLTAACETALTAMYTVDRLVEWATAWRAAGANVPDPPGTEDWLYTGTLPKEMLGGLRTIG